MAESHPKLLWSLTTGLVSLVVFLVSAWAVEQRSMSITLCDRVTTLERQFGIIDTKLDLLLQDRAADRRTTQQEQRR